MTIINNSATKDEIKYFDILHTKLKYIIDKEVSDISTPNDVGCIMASIHRLYLDFYCYILTFKYDDIGEVKENILKSQEKDLETLIKVCKDILIAKENGEFE